MKYVYGILIVIGALGFSHLCVYGAGRAKGYTKAYIEYQGGLNAQMQAIQNASKKILDFQKKIANNTDECFNRLWDESIIESVNPQLR